MATNIVSESALDVYRRIRSILSSTGTNLNEFCIAVNKCSNNKSHRYVLNSMNSAFDKVEFSPDLQIDNVPAKQFLAHSLFKIPGAVYMPKSSETKTNASNLGNILDRYLAIFVESKPKLKEYSSLFAELKCTAEFVAENSLHGYFGPLRTSTIKAMENYKKILLGDIRLTDSKKLSYAVQLLDVLKLHSIDSEDLTNMVINIVTKTPSIVTHCDTSTLESLYKLKLPQPCKKIFEEHVRSTAMELNDLKLWSELFTIASRSSENRNTIDCFLHSYKHVLRNYLRMNSADTASDGNPISTEILLNIINGMVTLQKRLKPKDPIFRTASVVLESIWQYIEKQIGSFQSVDMILVADCYFEMYRSLNLHLKQGARNCLDVLMREIGSRAETYLLRDWIAAFEAAEKIRDITVVNVLLQKSDYYLKVTNIQKTWIKDLSESLIKMDLNELIDQIYSLSVPQCSDLCKYLVTADVYLNPIDTVIERRCLSLISSVKQPTSRNIFDFYFAQFQMLLPEENGLRIALESNRSFKKLLENMSGDKLLQLLHISKYGELANVRLLLKVLSDKISSSIVVLTLSQSLMVLEYAKQFKNIDLLNAVLSTTVPRLLESIGSHKGYCQLLELSRFVLELPKIDGTEYSPYCTLDELIIQHSAPHVHHLALPHLELLLRNIDRSGHFPKRLIGAILSHGIDVDLQGLPTDTVLGMIGILSKLGIRHEHLIKRLEDWLLNNMSDKDSQTIAKHVIELANSMTNLGMTSTQLDEFFASLLNGLAHFTRWNFDSLYLETKVAVLHAIGMFGTINKDFESCLAKLVQECENATKCNSNAASCTKIDPETYRNLYEIYINMLISGFGAGTENSSVLKSQFLSQNLPCYHWFKKQEQLCLEFRNSASFISIKETLNELGLELAEPKVTEVYFSNFVIEAGENTPLLQNRNTVIVCVPKEDQLKWWTPISNFGNATKHKSNHVESYKVIIGKSARVTEHLKKSGWNVATVYMSEWETLPADKRTQYIRKILTQQA